VRDGPRAAALVVEASIARARRKGRRAGQKVQGLEMAVVARRTISFLCDMMRYAGLEPASALQAVGLGAEDTLPDAIPSETASRFIHEVVRAGGIGGAFEAAEALRLRSGFLAILSHELRTPLNGVVGFAEALATTELTPEQRGMVEQLRASADAMTVVLDDLLGLSEAPGVARPAIIPPPMSEAHAHEGDDARDAGTPAVEGDGEPPRVLVVDDIAANRLVASRLVERLGFEVDTATNGSEAVEALRQRRYSLVLMDCLMPVMNGFDAARAIREYEESTGRHTPIVAVSANALSYDRERCFEAGMDDFVEKPVRGAALETVISRWCVRAA
jgi:CheY-like chemotaxis protein